MTSAPYARPQAAASLAQAPVVYHAPGSQSSSTHPGTFAPGTKVQIGQHRVIVEKYLSEGGFAHVYVVRVPRDNGKADAAVLKRVAVPDREALTNMRTEVDTMKKLKGHKKIVTYIDSHASQLKGGGYEVFLLMEYCAGGGLIDFMNTRLQHRLTEPEILHIFADVAEGVAAMHYLRPPLLHRDLKVENVLISTSGSGKTYKLCDFGSAAPPRPAATSAAEGRLIEDDVQKHTTMQYRSPEMVDVYRKQPINEKSDIWALGVLLYKLCYYTTPFEEQGQMAILNASFKFPAYPSFSDRIKRLISSMLRENPQLRPNIYQAITEVCSMRGTQAPIKDIYSKRTESESRRFEQLPPKPSEPSPPPVVGLSKAAPTQVQSDALPDITPMRRGRPKQAAYVGGGPASKPPGSDPFAALDSKNYDTRVAAVEELAQKFPSLDEFSILHDQGKNYQFSSTNPSHSTVSSTANDSLKKRVTEALADEVFARPTMTHTGPASGSSTSPPKVNPRLQRDKQAATSSNPALTESNTVKSSMVSAGVQTSPLPSPSLLPIDIQKRPIWRVPRGKSPQNIPTRSHQDPPPIVQTELPPRPEPTTSRRYFLERTRTKSQTALSLPKATVSSRPSLEGQRPSMEHLESVEKSRSASARPRPSSAYVESNIEFLKDQGGSRTMRTSSSTPKPDMSRLDGNGKGASSGEETPDDHITSDVDFLKSIESSDDTSKKGNRRRSSSGAKTKRTNIPTISLSGTKNILAGKFGEAFRRFETNSSNNSSSHDAHSSEKEPLNLPTSPLSPIMGSEATGTSGRSDDYDHDLDTALEDSQALSPEVRRELERRRLSQEEKRVAAAAAEYRQRLERGDRSAPGPSKASSIQNRVRSLLDDSQSTQKVQRMAEGYGKYTESSVGPAKLPPRVIGRKPVPSPVKSGFDVKTSTIPSPTTASSGQGVQAAQRTGPRIAPKPLAFRTGTGTQPATANDEKEAGDWESNFSKRFPSLSGIEMVETEIAKGPVSRVRDV